jgi:hypothetical protein
MAKTRDESVEVEAPAAMLSYGAAAAYGMEIRGALGIEFVVGQDHSGRRKETKEGAGTERWRGNCGGDRF